MNNRYKPWPAGPQRLCHLLRLNGGAPVGIYAAHPDASALTDVHHALPEGAMDADQRLIAGLERVHEGGLHAGHARARHAHGPLVVGLEHPAQERLGFVHHPQVLRVQIAEQRGGAGAQHAGGNLAGARP